MKRFTYLVLMLPCLCHLSFAQTPEAETTDQFFDILAEHDLAMGSLAISVDGVPDYQRALGYAVINQNGTIPATTDTPYRIGSVSKLFTAVIVFQLVEEGTLSLDDTLERYVPGIPGSDEISLMDLLYHRSGLPHYTEAPDFRRDERKSRNELIRMISEMSRNATGKSGYEYSNTNYLLLSYVIDDVSGKSYEQVLSERILSRIGLHDTYFENEADSTRRESRSYKYSKFSWVPQKDDIAANHRGAGSLVSTPSDLIRFMDALFAGDLVSAESLRQMTTFVGEYGMGLFLYRFGDYTAYGHGGRINEFYTTLIHFPGEGLSIAYATNGMMYPQDDIVDAVVDIWMHEPYKMPDFTTSRIASEELEQYLGTYRSDFRQITVISKRIDNQLVLETKGENFDAIPYGTHKFVNMEYGFFFAFNPDVLELIIKEADNIYFLRRTGDK